ncbi:MAG: ThaI family type II restriction endonuclease [Bryobacteraceae bacterium]
MIFVQINWDSDGGLYFFPLDLQLKIFKKLGAEKYIKLPKAGTNPRGVEMTGEALNELINNKKCYNK